MYTLSLHDALPIFDMGERPARVVQVIRNPCNRRIEIPHLQMLSAMAPVAVEATFAHHIEPLHRNPVPLLVSRQNQIIGTYPEGVGSTIPACKHLTSLALRPYADQRSMLRHLRRHAVTILEEVEPSVRVDLQPQRVRHRPGDPVVIETLIVIRLTITIQIVKSRQLTPFGHMNDAIHNGDPHWIKEPGGVTLPLQILK